MIKIIEKVKVWRDLRSQISGRVGFVPTMGALHEGHISLIKKAVEENPNVIVSIFVNPTQFNDPKDFKSYPKTFEKDLSIIENAGAKFVFAPSVEEMYPEGYTMKVSETGLSEKFCGAFRPGHFEGMLTVVLKLLQIIEADVAYFGEKDFQQLKLVEKLVQAFFLKTQIVGCPTQRATDGLALSSRNLLLTPADRQAAPEFSKLLKSKLSPSEIKEQLSRKGFRVDYVEEWEGRRLGAVHLGSVRLIDNVQI